MNAERALIPQKVTQIEGVFSGTLSYIFNEFSTGAAQGPSFSTVVRTARDKGYTVRPLDRNHPNPDLTERGGVWPWPVIVATHDRNPTQRTT